jgi:hypothetical protein
LLTAADGIDCPFLICVLHQVALPHNIDASPIEVHTATSMSNTWAHTITSNINSGFFRKLFQQNIVVLRGGVIHWLARESGEIASYNVCTREHGTIKLPGPVINCNGELHLGSYYSHDENKLLRLVTLNKTFNISVWHQLPNGNWESEALMVDLEEKLRSLDPYSGMIVQFSQSSSEKTNIVLLHISIYVSRWPPTSRTIILDLETKEMRELHCPTSRKLFFTGVGRCRSRIHHPFTSRSVRYFSRTRRVLRIGLAALCISSIILNHEHTRGPPLTVAQILSFSFKSYGISLVSSLSSSAAAAFLLPAPRGKGACRFLVFFFSPSPLTRLYLT